jgi:dipeptidyl aminopeptidase/acylaminoacyl peptidase
MPPLAPYGTWRSPISTDLIVAGSVGLGSPTLEGDKTYWIESRPLEKGRCVLVCREGDGRLSELTTAPFSVRSRAHEYGGGAYCVHNGTIYFSNDKDQRLYRLQAGEEPQPLTPEAPLQFADGLIDPVCNRWIGVREDHRPAGESQDTLVAIDLAAGEQEGQILVSGATFYSSPRLSPDGTQLAWLSWNHPNMPWDGTELWLADLAANGSLTQPRCLAGGSHESIFQPEWSPDGQLYFVSDRTGWWNLYHWDGSECIDLCPQSAEFGLPQWVFGMSTYGFISSSEILCTYTQNGLWFLGRLDLQQGQLTEIPNPYSEISNLQVQGQRAVFLGGSADQMTAVVEIDLSTGRFSTLHSSGELTIDPTYLSRPQSIAFPTDQNRTAYGIFYPPTNPEYQAPADKKPPLLVKSHGGPTAQTRSGLNLGIQYWTSRGFAVLDVNYGGSTGYGRAYRQRLNGTWGIVDVQDCANGARYLAEQGLVDPQRLCIDGGSAGGYTTLCALTFTSVFKAGASRYGVSDLTALAEDTHKFESRYLDTLVGPYPQRQDLYDARSPIHHVDRLACPVIFFQGLEDKVVPPNQAEQMVAALRQKGLPVAYVVFPEEGHGFRQAETIKRALEGEFYFFARIFGFQPADPVEPIAIENLPDCG